MTDQLQINFSYPDAPGYKAEGPSKDAAHKVASRAEKLRRRIYGFMKLNNQGYTADEIAGLFKESCLSIRPRFSELLMAGLIVDTGVRRKNISGATASVWRAI